MAKYLSIDDGGLVEREAVASSAGSADAGKIPALDEDGRLDSSIATSFSPRGAWVSSDSYSENDIVTDGAGTFRAKTTHSGLSTSPNADTTNWEKWALGFNVREWVSSYTYYVNDIVTVNGKTFRCKLYLAASYTTPEDDPTYWEKWAEVGTSIVVRGAWVGGTAYAANDFVTDGGEMFRAKASHSGVYTQPASDATNWEKWVAKGEDGADGEDGLTWHLDATYNDPNGYDSGNNGDYLLAANGSVWLNNSGATGWTDTGINLKGADGADGDATAYSPADSGDWDGTAPTTIAEALDRCAELLKTLNSGTGP